jgi:hypothetical protein
MFGQFTWCRQRLPYINVSDYCEMKVRFHTQTLYVEYKIRKKGKKLMREREREREREKDKMKNQCFKN